MKEAIFHPEARVEMRESVEFYEARLEGLGLRFLGAVEYIYLVAVAHHHRRPGYWRERADRR